MFYQCYQEFFGPKNGHNLKEAFKAKWVLKIFRKKECIRFRANGLRNQASAISPYFHTRFFVYNNNNNNTILTDLTVSKNNSFKKNQL